MNSIKSIIVTIPIVISLFSCCSKVFPDEKLTLPRQEYTGDQLRIDGYYYSLLYTKDNKNVYEIYFLFKDGKILYCGTSTGLYLFEEKLIKEPNTFGSGKTDWGLFVIDSENIKFERWYPSSVGQGLPVYIQEGVILNDSTFKITRLYKNGESVNEKRDDLYHFKQFSPKPDSTNNFIK